MSADFGFSINLVFKLFNSIVSLGTLWLFLLAAGAGGGAVLLISLLALELGDFLLAVFSSDKGFESHSSCI